MRCTRQVAVLLVLAAAVFAVAGFGLPAGASDDPLFGRQWGLEQIRAPGAWATATGSGVTIGVVDTGVDTRHPDLAGKVVATADCVGGPCIDGGGHDDNGHGTIVSGIAAAVTGNGRGIAGVAPDAKLVVAKVLDSEGSGTVDDINSGIRWAVDNGARVVNLSLGDPDFLLTSLLGTPLRPSLEYAWARGAVPVLAAGNYHLGLLDLGSANYGSLDALIVGATDRSGAVPAYSSPIGNAKWGLVAPGGLGDGTADDNVISLDTGGGYVAAAGTSMAAPHVSGAVAALLGEGLSPAEAVQRLLATLEPSACGTGCRGRLDMAAAVSGARSSEATVAAQTVASPSSVSPAPTVQATIAAPPTTTTIAAPSGLTELAEPLVPTRSARAVLASSTDPAGRNPAVIVFAVLLFLAVGTSTGGVAWRRLIAGAGW